MTRIKICGVTNIDDALMSIDAGADALGFNFVPDTPRYLKDTKAAAKIIEQLPPFITTVGLFVNADPELIQSIADECHLDMLQLHGDESPQFCQGFNRRVIKAVRVKDESSCSHLSDYRVSGYLLDTYVKGALGGTGVAFDWQLAIKAKQYGRIVLAGGLDPDNVASAVQQVRPYGVDVSSRVEASPGRKDPVKVRTFIQNVKEVDREWKQSN
ncbi:phosphoribosylanthranilate isomerase [Candidatus Poribacteria bacterium]|nr:MAG: phosphoribosylanthranilate isomerase [Candidatus Poribacteria bacterium]